MLRRSGMERFLRREWGCDQPAAVANDSGEESSFSSEVDNRIRQIIDLMEQAGEMAAGLTEIVQTLSVQVQHLDASILRQARASCDQGKATLHEPADWGGF